MNLLIYLCVGIGLSIASPLDDRMLMIDPTPSPDYKPGLQELPKDIPEDVIKELRPREDPWVMIDPTPPTGYQPGYEKQKENPKELRPEVNPTRPGQYEFTNDPRLMIDPTPHFGYQPGYEIQKNIPGELKLKVNPTKPGQYELPNDPRLMIDPTPPPGYVPTIWDMRTDPTINPKEIEEEGEGEGPLDPELFLLHSGFADLEKSDAE